MPEQEPLGESVVVAETDRWVMRRRTERKEDGRTITYYTFELVEQGLRQYTLEMEAGGV